MWRYENVKKELFQLALLYNKLPQTNYLKTPMHLASWFGGLSVFNYLILIWNLSREQQVDGGGTKL